MEEALEAATKDLLERDHCERRQEGSQGHRNGHREGWPRTSEGEVASAVPQVRDTGAEPINEVPSAL